MHFLLGLICDGQDYTSKLGACLGQSLSYSDKSDTTKVVARLKTRGGMEQLIIVLAGPAGAGKSTAVTVAQRFCFKFFQSFGILWSDMTFVSTAYTGSAASLFGGVTIYIAAFINYKYSLSEDQKHE